LCFGDAGADPFRTGTDANDLRPAVTLRDMDGRARRAEQAHGGFGDLDQRALGIAGGAGDGLQDIGAGALAIARGPQLGLQAVIFRKRRLELPLETDNHLLQIGHRIRGKRRHSINPFWPVTCGQTLNQGSACATPPAYGNGLFHPGHVYQGPVLRRRRKTSRWLRLRSPALKPRSPCW
jgi:hypothetical protein